MVQETVEFKLVIILRPAKLYASSGERSGAQKVASGIKIRQCAATNRAPATYTGAGCCWRRFIIIHNRRMKWIPTLISRLRAALHQEAPEPRVPQGTSAPQACPPTSRL